MTSKDPALPSPPRWSDADQSRAAAALFPGGRSGVGAFDLRAFLLGIAMTVFALAPAIGAWAFLLNEQIYQWSMVAAIVIAAWGPLTGRKYDPRFHWGVGAFVFFFFLMMVRMPSFDQEAWLAFFSVGLCLALLLLSYSADEVAVVRGILTAVLLIGTLTALLVLFDPNYAFARTYGWNREREAYLITSPTISAAIGPAVLAARYTARPFLKPVLYLLAAFLLYSLANVLGRAALLSGVACLFLAFTFSANSHGHAKALAAIRGLALCLPLIPVGIILLSRNRYLWGRLQRMLDPANELDAGGRGYIWQSSVEFIEDNTLWGGGVTSIQDYIGVYPHNALLEGWGDLGVFGFVVILSFFAAFGFSLWSAMLKGRSALAFALHLVAFVFVLEAIKSGSLYLSRPMMIFTLLALTLPCFRKEAIQTPHLAAAKSEPER